MADIHSTQEAYEQIAEALNWLDGHGEQILDSRVTGGSHLIAYDPDAEKWFVAKVNLRVRENG